jgi:hypothetical protein
VGSIWKFPNNDFFTEKTMRKGLGIGAGIGVGLMFFFDPTCGKHRRSVVGHSFAWLGKHIGRGVAWPIARIV